MAMIYFIIFILFVAYILWTWHSSAQIESMVTRISFIGIGTLFIALVTFLLFSFSQIGVDYPVEEMAGSVRSIVLLIFIPINGFVIIPQIFNYIGGTKNGTISEENKGKVIRRICIIAVILIIFECIYFKNIQTGIINYINIRQ